MYNSFEKSNRKKDIMYYGLKIADETGEIELDECMTLDSDQSLLRISKFLGLVEVEVDQAAEEEITRKTSEGNYTVFMYKI
jgi:hypothetical protein